MTLCDELRIGGLLSSLWKQHSNICHIPSQDIGRTVLEYIFPPRNAPRSKPSCVGTWEALKSGRAFQSAVWWELLTGSAAEGLGVPYYHGKLFPGSDDMMYLYGGVWGVRVADDEQTGLHQTPFVMSQINCPAGYCRVKVTAVDDAMMERMAQTMVRGGSYPAQEAFMVMSNVGVMALVGAPVFLSYYMLAVPLSLMFPASIGSRVLSFRPYYKAIHHLGKLPLLNRLVSYIQVGGENTNKLMTDREGQVFLSSRIVRAILCDTRLQEARDGPAQTSGLHDFVTALICSGRFPCISNFLSRPRCPQWPNQKDLNEIAVLPGLLVTTGKKGSVNRDLEFRKSFSLQELCLARSMPLWVKSAFKAAKYTLSYVKKGMTGNENAASATAGNPSIGNPDDQEEGRSVVSSFHLKNVLLWLLEEADTWRQMCSFRLMIRLLVRLDYHLETGHLLHYFNPDCDLLDTVPEEERQLVRYCVKVILSNPVEAMAKQCISLTDNPNSWRGSLLDWWFDPKGYLVRMQNEFRTALKSWKEQRRV